ncbi:hypothetical protein G3578_09370 [Brevibacillus sp. SYP-B805]|jgi:hypothetical protein|uniref:hypothetical protein n=1 Tax=Brevibacillus sp. SYP-B805 TaxID=1578199 RepID=UPI0013EDEEA5|nr:hypothetical protein [Brevibacillus sp. SYP-B805]NGQ95364.1 hypothetical protein [Brevibacillus sp. SYP-B805]
MSTTELMLKTDFEGRVLRTLQSYYRRSNHVLIRESLWANGMSWEDVDYVMSLLDGKYTVSEIMDILREKGIFAKRG